MNSFPASHSWLQSAGRFRGLFAVSALAGLLALPAQGQVALAEGSSVFPSGLGDLAPYGGNLVHSVFDTFSGGFTSPHGVAVSLSFKLTTEVYSGVALNPYTGGLTFVYKLENLSTNTVDQTYSLGSQTAVDEYGITALSLFGFTGFKTSVGQGLLPPSGVFLGDGVVPGEAVRSDILFDGGDMVTFTYPPAPFGSNGPPIYANERSNELVVFTDANGWVSETATVTHDLLIDARGTSEGVDRLTNPETYHNLAMLAPTTNSSATVPDGTSSLFLSGMGLGFLSFVARRRRS